MKIQFSHQGDAGLTAVTVERVGEGRYQVQVGESALHLDVHRVAPGQYHVLDGTDGHDVVVLPAAAGRPGLVLCDGQVAPVALLDEQQAARAAHVSTARAGARGADGTVAIRAPMPGKVVKRLVEAGQTISAGQGVIVIEAMKMENELRSPVDGLVKELRAGEGDAVEAGEPLVVVE
jgi:biotin carboxyl carrier protein